MTSIILDLDGTLWDSTTSITKAWNRVLERYELPLVDAPTLHGLFGKTMDVIMSEMNVVDQNIIKEIHIEEEAVISKDGGILYDDVIQTIKTLVQRGHQVFIVSNCQKGYIELFLSQTGLKNSITDHLCWGDTMQVKGENLKQIIKKHQLKKPIYVGDTITDEEATRLANIPFYYASYGFGDAKNPTCILTEFKTLLDHV